jgi:hypothetical protein
MPCVRKHAHSEDPGRQTVRELRHAIRNAGLYVTSKSSEGIVNHHVHCSVCDYAALFSVRRFRKVGFELLCEVHFEWLQDNTRRPFEVRRVMDPCECSRAAGLTIAELDEIVAEEAGTR